MPPRPLEFASTPDRSYNGEPLTWHEERWEQAQDLVGDSAIAFYRDLARCLRVGGPPPIDPLSVRRNFAIIERCRAQITAHMAACARQSNNR